MTESSSPDTSALRARLTADIAAGRTVSLAAEDLADPEVRRRLPKLLEELTAAAAARPPSPVHIPGYTLLGEIGHGGMSTVYLARQDALDRYVAVKIAPKWLAGDKRMQQRLLQEARAMARVSHPNIVAIHDILEIDDTVAIAMDWIDGRTLTALLAELPPQPDAHDMQRVRDALGTPASAGPLDTNVMRFFVRIVRDVALAVHHVHAAGLLHLDIKPSNILVRRDGTPLLADFGVVREIDVASTNTRTFAGTPVYAAPEQLQRADARFGPHTDVYALGMTLYELVARNQPLRQLGITRVLHDVIGGRIPALAKHTHVPGDLANIVHKAIAPEPQRRYASATAFADDLGAFLEHRPVTARALTRMQRLRRWARNEPWKATLAAVLLVLLPTLAGLGAYVNFQMPRIAKAVREERLARASDLKQAGYQSYFVTHCVDGEPSRMLMEAMDCDPSASSLACLLAMAHEEGLPLAAGLLATFSDTVGQHLGLRLFAGKVANRRAFFVADEVAQLRTSTDPIDKYVLALDRLFFAEDRSDEQAYQDAEERFDEATLMAGLDPLLIGLRLWASGRTGRPELHATLVRAIRARWPDDMRMLSWIYYSLEPIDRPAAVAVAEAMRRQDPRHPASWEMLAGECVRRGDYAGAIAQVEQARSAGVTSHHLDMHYLMAIARRDGKAAAMRSVQDMPVDMMTEARRLQLLRLADPAAAEQRREEVLATPDASRQALRFVYYDASEHDHIEHADRAWQRFRESYPDRRSLFLSRFGELWNRQDPAQAAKLLADITIPLQATTTHWQQICSMLVTAHDWASLARHAGRWHGLADAAARPEAAFYRALAAQRLGDLEAIGPLLAVALSVRNDEKQWYATALVEDAWFRVDPKSPAAFRDPALAARRMAEFDAFVARRSERPKLKAIPQGPWVNLVRAEVLFANGDRAGALAAAERAGRYRGAEPQAPDDWSARVVEALERFRKP